MPVQSKSSTRRTVSSSTTQFVDGTVAAPVGFDSNLLTGIYYANPGVGVSDNGVQAAGIRADYMYVPSNVVRFATTGGDNEITCDGATAVKLRANGLDHITATGSSLTLHRNTTCDANLVNKEGAHFDGAKGSTNYQNFSLNDGVQAFSGVTGQCNYFYNQYQSAYHDCATAEIEVAWTGKGSATGDVQLVFPFLIQGDSLQAPCTIGIADGITVTGRLFAEVSKTQHIFFYQQNGATSTRLNATSHFSTSGRIRMTVSTIHIPR